MQWLLVKLPFWIYQTILSPALHVFTGSQAGCRFEPSCSRYSQEAILTHGPARGGWLSVCRFLRCHPFSEGGIDPVPRYDIGSTRKVRANGS